MVWTVFAAYDFGRATGPVYDDSELLELETLLGIKIRSPMVGVKAIAIWWPRAVILTRRFTRTVRPARRCWRRSKGCVPRRSRQPPSSVVMPIPPSRCC